MASSESPWKLESLELGVRSKSKSEKQKGALVGVWCCVLLVLLVFWWLVVIKGNSRS
jgi:hypothetical protein